MLLFHHIVRNQARDVLYQTRETAYGVSSGYPNTEKSIFDEIRGVWIADETLSRVFDISSQSKNKN